MTPSYSFDVDVRRSLVRITLGGFFTQSDIEGFLAARAKAHTELRCGPNEHLTLTDVRGMKIQMQEMVGAWGQVLAAPDYRSRRLAFVQGNSLTRLQLRRAAASRDVRYFDDIGKAEAWLLRADAERTDQPPQRATG
ncbi:MAG: hypothetical protein ACKVOB_08885 [Sphingomonas sp.]